MSILETFIPASASALAAGDTVLSPLGFVGTVVDVQVSDETHGPTQHWHVIIRNDNPLAAALFGEQGEVVAVEEDIFMVRAILPDLAPSDFS